MSQQEISNTQRALIFQGGALGAYEAGVFKEICKKVKRNDEERRNKKQINLFNIVAGTSIGAINAAVIVGHFLKNNSWKVHQKNSLSFGKEYSNNQSTVATSTSIFETLDAKRLT
jgi:NTE family protein